MNLTLEDLIADGRIRTRPYTTYSEPTVLDVSLDDFRGLLSPVLKQVYVNHDPIRNRYSGSAANITASINSDCDAIVDYALLQCYNRLRGVAERYSTTVRTARLNPRAPVNNRMEFPTWISSLLSSIGPLRISDGPCDILVIYAPPAGTMNHYGRTAAQNPNEGHYHRLIMTLKDCGVATSPLDFNAAEGSFWTTCQIISNDEGLYSVLGTVHPSHYTNDDVLRAAILQPPPANQPFQDIGFTVDIVDDAATLTALAAVAAPEGLPPGAVATGPGRPISALYNVNHFGIRPANEATHTTRACYIIGRGVNRVFTCYLAEHITSYEVLTLLRSALLARAAPAPAPAAHA